MSEYQPQMAAHGAINVMVAVVDSAQGKKVLELCRQDHVLLDLVCRGHGTAHSEMLDLLGIGETAKAIILCLTSAPQAKRLLTRLGRELEMRYPGRGIAFSMPVTGIGMRWHKLLTQADGKEDSCVNSADKACGYAMVAVIMEQGYTNLAMEAARKAGARGGTVISARGIAENEVEKFFGIEIQAEKEVLFLVVKSEGKQTVMTAIMKAVGMNTKSHGIVLSLPVSDAIGLAD